MTVFIVPFLLIQFQGSASPFVRSAEEECRRLSTTLGCKVSVDRRLGKEVLYVDGRGKRPEVELRTVATALHASVQRAVDGFAITRTLLDEKGLVERRAQERLGWLQRCMDVQKKFRASHMKDPEDSASILNYAKSQAQEVSDYNSHKIPDHGNFSLTAQQLLPSETLMEKLIMRLGPKELCAIPCGEGRVWENEPSGSAVLKLPESSDLLEEYNSTQEALSRTLIPTALRQDLQLLHVPTLWEGGAPRVVRVRLSFLSSTNLMSFNLEGADIQGNVRVRSYFYARPTDVFLNSNEIANRLERAHIAKPLHLTPEEMSMDGLTDPIPGIRLPDWALHPDTRDPLGFLVAKVFGSIEDESPQKCFVADLSDGFFWLAMYAVKGDVLDVRQFESLVLQSLPYEQVVTSEAVVWRPTDPEEVEGARADRKLLANFMRTKVNGGMVTTYEKGCLVHSSPSLPASLGTQWLRIWDERVKHDWQSADFPLPRLLFLLGAIGASDWENLLDGQTRTADELGVRDELDRLVKSDQLNLKFGNPLPSETVRHAIDTLGVVDVGRVRFSVHPVRQQMVMDWDSERRPRSWHQLQPQILGNVGKVTAEYNPVTDSSTITSDRKLFEESLSAWRYQLGTLQAGVLLLEFPHSGVYEFPLTGVINDATSALKFSDLDPALQEQMWELAQRFAIERSTEEGRASERLRRSSDPTRIGGGE